MKTIENIAGQEGPVAALFCTSDVFRAVARCYSGATVEALKAAAASTLSRLLRANPQVLRLLPDLPHLRFSEGVELL